MSRKAKTETSTTLAVRMLDEVTWPAFARLVEANNGIWGGCWCMGFHVKLGKGRTPEQNRAEKEQRVREGRTHAALVFDGDECVGWCQFGPRRAAGDQEQAEVREGPRDAAGLAHHLLLHREGPA